MKTLKQYVLEASNDIDPDFFQFYKIFLKEAMRVVFKEKLHEVPQYIEAKLNRAIQTVLKVENHFDMVKLLRITVIFRIEKHVFFYSYTMRMISSLKAVMTSLLLR